MLTDKDLIRTKDFIAKPGKAVDLRDWATDYRGRELNKPEAEQLLAASRLKLAEIQDKLYADNRYGVLIILQAMDAAGKDGAIKHIMSGFNPLGVKVYSFKTPNATELDHDYFWRHELALPARGEIAIHNRSHYENVLVTRVHPEYILNEHIPGIDSLKKVDRAFWKDRFRQIRRFEKNLLANGTIVLKFFLHLSPKEQKRRFLERIDDPVKNWKFSLADLRERARWDDYQTAYNEAIGATSTEGAPWYIVPADEKWFARLAIATIIHDRFDALRLRFPVVSAEQKSELAKAKRVLVSEKGGKKRKK